MGIAHKIYVCLAQNREIQKKNLLYEQQLERCNKYIQEKERKDLKMQEMCHDMKSHLISLSGMVQGNDLDRARAYIQCLLQNNVDCDMEEISCTGNVVVDSLLNYKCAEAKRLGIDFRVNVFLPENLPFQPGNLTIILGNLIDNALEACQNSDKEKRFIYLDAVYEKGVFVLKVCNSCREKRRRNKDGHFPTTKRDASVHGIGLRSVEQAIESYQGELLTEWKNEVFYATVILYAGSAG